MISISRIFQKIYSLLGILFVALFLVFLGGIFSKHVSAEDRSFYYSKIHVDVKVNEDSTMDISETITYHFTGRFREVYRQITLQDYTDIEYCKKNSSAQCGGFEFMLVKDVLDGQGHSLAGKYKEYELDDVYQRRYEVAWEFAPGGREFDGEDFTWTVNYKIFGGLGYFQDYDLFYWNLLFEDRADEVKDFSATIKFPKDTKFKESDLRVLGNFTYEYLYDPRTHELELTTENVPAYSDYTAILRIPKDVVKEYGKLDLVLDPEIQNVEIEGKTLQGVTGRLYGLPAGKIDLTFKMDGYYSKPMTINLKEGETQSLEVKLEPTLITRITEIAVISINALSCIFIPIFAYFLYAWWNRKGRDRGGKKTIVPWFEPPDKIPPYLLGSLKDERVDLTDLTGSIIDLAYRGFIKIKELGGNKVTGYEFIKRKEFSSSTEITDVERTLLDSLLGSEESITTDDLKYQFYVKIPTITDKIYDEMVTKSYFDRRPDKVRSKYLIFGIIGIAVGFTAFSFLPIIGLYTPPLAILLAGAMTIFISFFMPAKTPSGTEVNEEIKGFRMYLYTAERFRLQKLKPETFEKYLSYAIVFGIEKEWAKKFKDIYKKMPDWYESTSGRFNTFNALNFASSLSKFNTVSASTFSSSPGSGGSSGGGWSGGGGFSGGFSGGGGGGGGGGAR